MIQIDEHGIGHDNIEVWSADTDRFFKAKIPAFNGCRLRYSTAYGRT